MSRLEGFYKCRCGTEKATGQLLKQHKNSRARVNTDCNDLFYANRLASSLAEQTTLELATENLKPVDSGDSNASQ